MNTHRTETNGLDLHCEKNLSTFSGKHYAHEIRVSGNTQSDKQEVPHIPNY